MSILLSVLISLFTLFLTFAGLTVQLMNVTDLSSHISPIETLSSYCKTD